jgi:hypothetical protein
MTPLADPVRVFRETGVAEGGNLTRFLRSRPGLDPEMLRPLWEQHRDVILTAWAEQFPGRRPWAWWSGGDAPELRQVLQRDPAPTCAIRRRAWGVVPLHPDIAVTIESQAAYLQRLALLTAEERRRLPPAAYAPVVLAPGEIEHEEDTGVEV